MSLSSMCQRLSVQTVYTIQQARRAIGASVTGLPPVPPSSIRRLASVTAPARYVAEGHHQAMMQPHVTGDAKFWLLQVTSQSLKRCCVVPTMPASKAAPARKRKR